MFGIIYLALNGITSGLNYVDKLRMDTRNKREAIKNNNLTYYGSRGGTYLCSNDRPVTRTTDARGHDILKDLYNGTIYYDYTEEEINKQKGKFNQNGESVYLGTQKERNEIHKQYEYTGLGSIDYIDIATGRPVRTICINGYTFYMDVETGLIMRLADDGIPRDSRCIKGLLTPNDIIRFFNKRQEKLQRFYKYNKNGNEWTRIVYYLCKHIDQPIYMNAEGLICKSCLKETNSKEYNQIVNNYYNIVHTYNNSGVKWNNKYLQDIELNTIDLMRRCVDSYDVVPLIYCDINITDYSYI